MAEITPQRQGQMIRELFRILAEAPEGLRAKDAIKAVEDRLELSDFERSTFPNNPDVVRFPKILRFATINSVKAGWLLKRNGIWTVTEEGEEALREFGDPADLFQESRRLYKEWEASRPPDEDVEGLDVEPTSDQGLIAAATLEEASESARQAILDHLGTINAYAFQDLVGMLLEAMGYHVVSRVRQFVDTREPRNPASRARLSLLRQAGAVCPRQSGAQAGLSEVTAGGGSTSSEAKISLWERDSGVVC